MENSKSELTLRQKRFLKYYLEDPTNQSEAARKAGYAPNGAAQTASRLLSNPIILPYLTKAVEEHEVNVRLSEEDIFQKIEGMSETNIFDIVEVQNGRCLLVKDLDTVPYEMGQFIKKIKETPHGIEVEFYGKERALDLLTKIKGMQTVKMETSIELPKEIIVKKYGD